MYPGWPITPVQKRSVATPFDFCGLTSRAENRYDILVEESQSWEGGCLEDGFKCYSKEGREFRKKKQKRRWEKAQEDEQRFFFIELLYSLQKATFRELSDTCVFLRWPCIYFPPFGLLWPLCLSWVIFSFSLLYFDSFFLVCD